MSAAPEETADLIMRLEQTSDSATEQSLVDILIDHSELMRKYLQKRVYEVRRCYLKIFDQNALLYTERAWLKRC